jgi:adenylate cyclase
VTSGTPSPLEQPGGAGLTVDELATASGIATTDIEALVAAGVLPTGQDFRASDITKARLVTALVEAGFALDELSGAITQGRLSFDYVEHLMPEPVQYLARPDRSDNRRYREELRPILGGIDRGDGTIRADEVAVAELVARGVELGAPMERIVRIVRSMAQTAEHLVDLQRDFIDDVLLGPAIVSTGSPIAALAETAPSRFEFRELGRRLWWLLLERSADQAIFNNIVQLTERACAKVVFRR